MLERYGDVLTVSEISKILKISKHLARRLIITNKLKGFMIGREYRVSKIELEKYIKQ